MHSIIMYFPVIIIMFLSLDRLVIIVRDSFIVFISRVDFTHGGLTHLSNGELSHWTECTLVYTICFKISLFFVGVINNPVPN